MRRCWASGGGAVGVGGPALRGGPHAPPAARAERRFALRSQGYEMWSHL